MNSSRSNTEAYQPHITPTPQRLRGKTALITGGARGIGKAIALRFAQESADIFIVDKDLDEAQATARQVAQLGVAPPLIMRCFQPRCSESAVNEAIRLFGSIDILVNNAGMIVFGSLMECRPEDWDLCCRWILPGLFTSLSLLAATWWRAEKAAA